MVNVANICPKIARVFLRLSLDTKRFSYADHFIVIVLVHTKSVLSL